MLCENCGERNGVVTLTTIVNNQVKQEHLCETCAAQRGVETTIAAPKHPLGALLQAAQQQLAVPSGEAGRCTFCGSTMNDFRTTGRWGCARCYATFEASMRELLRRVHGNSRHAGQAYEPPQPQLDERATILGELKERLRRAIETEQFELAADLRDRIRVIE
jgi:protein arginine kinase activator